MILELVSSEIYEDGERIIALLDVTDDDGRTTRLAYLFPRDTIEWRAAEYDLDPLSDAELLTDIVLFEPHVTIPEEKRLYRTSKAEAKEALLALVKAEKDKSDQGKAAKRKALPAARLAEVQGGEEEIRRNIRAMSHVHPQVVEAKRQYVDQQIEDQNNRPAKPDRVTASLRELELRDSGTQAGRAAAARRMGLEEAKDMGEGRNG